MLIEGKCPANKHGVPDPREALEGRNLHCDINDISTSIGECNWRHQAY